MTDPGSRQQRTIYFHGRVQGVGFRYTTHRIAARFTVAGYVQNLPDGRVCLVAVGQSAELDRFVDALDDHLGRFVTHRQQSIQPDTGQFHRFEIRY